VARGCWLALLAPLVPVGKLLLLSLLLLLLLLPPQMLTL
jgi:hypothetical protein